MSDEYSYEVKEGVRLLKIRIIYGANASGKTNILNAFNFFRMLVLRMPKDRNETTQVVPFMLDDSSRNEKTRMSMVFYINKTKYILSFELDAKYIHSETLIVYDSIRPTKLYSRTYDASTDSSVIEFGTNLKMVPRRVKESSQAIPSIIVACLQRLARATWKEQDLMRCMITFAKQVKDVLAPGMLLSGYIKSQLDKDENGDLKNFILNFLKASDFNIEDVALNEEEELITPELEQLIQNAPIGDEAKADMLRKGKITNTELTFKHKVGDRLYELSEEYESNGTMRFMGLAVILNFLLKTNRFVPIDEVETSIHYELLAYFLKVFLANSDGTSQMLLTTHDINLLNEDFIRRDIIWFTDKDELGETRIVRLSNLSTAQEPLPYNAYKQGKLVKLPFLGSQYLTLNNQ